MTITIMLRLTVNPIFVNHLRLENTPQNQSLVSSNLGLNFSTHE